MSHYPRFEIIAHRGASRDRLENSMAAFHEAITQGADAFELDVHATSDGVVVVHHDGDIAVEASELQPRHDGRSLTINATDYTALARVRLANGEPVPTLDAVLDVAAGCAAVYVEVKGAGIEAQVADCLARHPATRTAVHSFDHRIPREVGRHRDALLATGILSASYVLDFSHMIHAAGARDLWQYVALIDQALVNEVHAAGARVIAWTENEPDHAADLVQMGVDAICTDIPEAIRRSLIARGALSQAR